ncbi:MAG: NTP transferase domain-containing protein [Atribacterota bacterium]
MDALLLAGRKDTGTLESHNKLNNKAFLMINQIPMIEYVVDALNQAKEIQSIVVVGPEDDLNFYVGKKVDKIIESTDSIINNIKLGIDYVNNDRKLMVLTSDIPLITGEIIDRFIEECKTFEALLYYPFIEKEIILQKYPETIRSYANLKEGTFCGGNIVIFSRSLFEKNKVLLNELYQHRKDIKKYITLLGMRFIVKYLFKSLTIKEIEKRATEIVGYKVKGIKVQDPEMMIDLDKLSDYELISQILK